MRKIFKSIVSVMLSLAVFITTNLYFIPAVQASGASIALKSDTVKFGESIEFTVNEYDTAPDEAKWIALYDVTDTNGIITEEIKYSYRTYIYPNGGKDYTFKTDATKDNGTLCQVGRKYKIRLYSDFNYAEVCESSIVNVVTELPEVETPTVTACKATVTMGESIDFTIADYDISNTAAWIALYDVTDTDGEITEEIKESYKHYLYLNGSGTYSFSSSSYCQAGRIYKAKLWANGEYLPVCESSVVSVIEPNAEPQVTVTPELVDADGTVTVSISGIDPKASGLWLSFVDSTEGNIFRYYDYKYANVLNDGKGTFTFDPTGSGNGDWGYKCEIGKSYKFFLFTDDGYNRVATSNIFTVNSPPEIKDLKGEFDYTTNKATISGRITSGKGKEIGITLNSPIGEEKSYTTTSLLDGQFTFETTDIFTTDGIYDITATGPKVETPVSMSFKHDSNDSIPEVKLTNSIMQRKSDIGVFISGVSDKEKNYKLSLYSESTLLWEKSISELYFTDKTFYFNGEKELSPANFQNSYNDGNQLQFKITENGIPCAEGIQFTVVSGAYSATEKTTYARSEQVKIKVDNRPNPKPRDWLGMYKANEDNKIKLIWYGYLEEMKVQDGYYIFDPETAFLEGFFMENASQYKGGESFKLRLFSGDNYDNVLYTTQPFDVIADAELSAEATASSDSVAINGVCSAGKDAIINLKMTSPDGTCKRETMVTSENGEINSNLTYNTAVYGKYIVEISSPNCTNPVTIAFDNVDPNSELISTASLQKKIMLTREKITITLTDVQNQENDYIALYEAEDESLSNPIWTNKLSNVMVKSPLDYPENQIAIEFNPDTVLTANKEKYIGGNQYRFVIFYGNSRFVQCKTEKFSLDGITADCIVNVAKKTVEIKGALSSKTAQSLELSIVSPTGKRQSYELSSDITGEFSKEVQIPFAESGFYEVVIRCAKLDQEITVTFEYNMNIVANVTADYQNQKLVINGRVIGEAEDTVSALVKNSAQAVVFEKDTKSKLYGEFFFEVPIVSETSDIYEITLKHKEKELKVKFEYNSNGKHSVTVNNQTREVTIGGYSALKAGLPVTLKILNPQSSIDKLAQVNSDEVGYFEYSYTLSSSAGGKYKAYIGGISSSAPAEVVFEVANIAQPSIPDWQPPGYSENGGSIPTDIIIGDRDGLGATAGVPKEVTNVANPILEVKELSDSSQIVKEFAKAANNHKLIKTFMINLFDSQTLITKVEGGKIKVTIPFDGDVTKKYVILCYNDDKTITELAAVYQGGKLSFETDHFSLYAIAVKSDTTVLKPTPVPQTGVEEPISEVWILPLSLCVLWLLRRRIAKKY